MSYLRSFDRGEVGELRVKVNLRASLVLAAFPKDNLVSGVNLISPCSHKSYILLGSLLEHEDVFDTSIDIRLWLEFELGVKSIDLESHIGSDHQPVLFVVERDWIYDLRVAGFYHTTLKFY